MGLRGRKQQKSAENYIMRSLMCMDLHTVVLEQGGGTEHVTYVGDETDVYKCSTAKPQDKKDS